MSAGDGDRDGDRDWRAARLSLLRRWISEADPDAVEERKWVKPTNPEGVPVWSDQGIICTGETYKDHVKLTFAQGASLEDPSGLFNASLEGNLRRAIDLREADELDEQAFKELIGRAVERNRSPGPGRRPGG
ncbi:MAG: DUF1801 domain-containing protein [Actinomycetota bacterium]|nr:DUF1801 domain-containing protein [Actinomycetota bacterium]